MSCSAGHSRQWKRERVAIADADRPSASVHPDSGTASSARAAWTTAVLVFLAALAVRLGLLNATPHFDEYYHLLPAQTWLETGTLGLLDGVYTRGAPYTLTVARLFDVTGRDDLTTARLVSLVPGVLLPVLLLLWVRSTAGGVAGLAVAIFAIAWPQGIVEAQFLRFYSAQAFLFVLGAIAVYQAVEARGPSRLAWALLAVPALLGALELQLTSAIGLLAILGWVLGLVVFTAPALEGRRLPALAALAGIGLLALGGLWVAGPLTKAWEIYRWVPAHSEHMQDYVAFYHHSLRGGYVALWALFPLAVILAYRVNPRLTCYCVAIFGLAIVVQSFAATKALRYISYAMPFFFVVLGLAISVIVPALGAVMRDFGWPRWLSSTVLAASAAFILLSHGLTASTAKLALGQTPDTRKDWRGAAELLGDWHGIPFRMTTHELQTVAYVGDYDILVSISRLSDLPELTEFGRDVRTGRPIIASADAIGVVLACQRDGVLLSSPKWLEEAQLGQAMTEALRAEGLATEHRTAGDVSVMRWFDPARRPPDCSAYPL